MLFVSITFVLLLLLCAMCLANECVCVYSVPCGSAYCTLPLLNSTNLKTTFKSVLNSISINKWKAELYLYQTKKKSQHLNNAIFLFEAGMYALRCFVQVPKERKHQNIEKEDRQRCKRKIEKCCSFCYLLMVLYSYVE